MTDWIATDLDSTLFNRAWAAADAIPATWNLEPDSSRTASSWMKSGTHRLLEVLGKSFALVPVTARDLDSFSRVEIQDLNLRGPAIIANGAFILGWDGKPDPLWQETMISLLTPWHRILDDFCAWLIEKSAGHARPRLIPGPADLPAYLVAKAAPGWWKSAAGQAILVEMDWLGCRVEILGLELQVLPPGIGKRDATLELQRRYFADQPPLLCLGDMPLDLEFMRLGEFLATPMGSTLEQAWLT
jgi:hydroxymethylpyrimidine pyrophosphatase-like HAD family hydrolase